MNIKWAIGFCLLTIVFLSGCAMGIYPKGATEDYKLGYKAGLNAGGTSGEAVSAGMTAGMLCLPYSGNIFASSQLPDTVKQKIQGESPEYQRGFANGWVHRVKCDADFYSMLYDWLWCEGEND